MNNNTNILKDKNLNKTNKRGVSMIREYGGIALSSLMVFGATGRLTQFHIQSVVIMGVVIVILSTFLWTYLYDRGLHIFFSALTSAVCILFFSLYFQSTVFGYKLLGVAYLLTSFIIIKTTIGEIVNETNNQEKA